MLTISRRQNLTFYPESQQKLPEGERSGFLLRPMSLALEDEMLQSILDRGQASDGGVKRANIDVPVVNKVFRNSVIGFVGAGAQDSDGKSVDFDQEWKKSGLPDWVVQGITLDDRWGVFNELIAQAGMKGETEVEKSES